MGRVPAVRPEEVIRVLERIGFQIVRQRGSHIRLRHQDGRVVTVPAHRGQDLGRGMLRKILRDAELTQAQFLNLLRE